MSKTMIRYENFSFKYEGSAEWAIQDINLDVNEGEIMLVLGRSGCGKSTMALALNGAVPHLLHGDISGSLTVAGLDTFTHTVANLTQHVGIVFQDPEIQLFALTVEDEVAMSLESYGVPREEMLERVEWAMAVCGISHLRLNAPAKLSGGQKQRVAIAAMLAREPDILVFDEPTGNLDPVGSRAVYETIRRICDDRGRTILLVEHDLAPVIDLVDRTVVLEKGEIIFEGRPRELLKEVELLRSCGVKIPAATEFGWRVERRGFFQYPDIPLTLDEAVTPLRATLMLPAGTFIGAQPVADEDKVAPSANGRPDPLILNEAGQVPIIDFRDVVHQYDTGHKALNGINLQIYPGEFVALCGMNGAGKTTAALHIMGLLKPTQGEVFVDRENTRARTVAEMARTVGLIFQNPNHQLFKDTVAGEIAFGPRNLGWSDVEIEEATERVLKLVELEGFAKTDPESLSMGQKQRVAVASVLVMNPRILLLDEPTTGQDQRTLKPFMDLIARLNREGTTVVMITHDMDVAMNYASRMVVMAGGQVIADGTPEAIFLREEVLQKAELHLPGILTLTKALNGQAPLYVDSFDMLEERLGL